jgi:hypothetical protein
MRFFFLWCSIVLRADWSQKRLNPLVEAMQSEPRSGFGYLKRLGNLRM